MQPAPDFNAEMGMNAQNRTSVRAARFGMGFLAVQIAIAAPWLTWDYLRHRLTGMVFAESIILLALLSLGFWLLFTRYRRIALEELKELTATQEIPID